jgi:hypothetical protein
MAVKEGPDQVIDKGTLIANSKHRRLCTHNKVEPRECLSI